MLLPGITQRLALSALPFLVFPKMAHREPGQHDRPPRAAGLRLGDLKFAADSLHSQAHVKLPRSEMDVIPPQRQQLTTAKTGGHRQDYRTSSRSPSITSSRCLASAMCSPTRRSLLIGDAFTCVATFLVTSLRRPALRAPCRGAGLHQVSTAHPRMQAGCMRRAAFSCSWSGW